MNLGLCVLAFFTEGFRLAQMPNALSLITVCPLIFICSGVLSTVWVILFALLLLVSTWGLTFGNCSFDGYRVQGPYKAGFKVIRTDKFDNEVQVYYPMDEAEYDRNKDTDRNIFLIYPKTFQYFLTGFGYSISTSTKSQVNPPAFLFRPYQPVRVGAILEAPVAKDFATGGKKLIPMVFSHGLSAHRAYYTMVGKDFASQGYVVFGINHCDGSAAFRIDRAGNPHYYDYKHDKFEQPFRS